jgi:6-pyruvoyltetrahydropterin/6-carboxytetrahydropterin synthase
MKPKFTSTLISNTKMYFILSQKFSFEAAHSLDREVYTESSKRIHGHTYNVEVSIRGDKDPATGMVIDIGYLEQGVQKAKEGIDHRLLDETPGLQQPPTLENICLFIAAAMPANLKPYLHQIRVWRDGLGDSCTMMV